MSEKNALYRAEIIEMKLNMAKELKAIIRKNEHKWDTRFLSGQN